MELGQLFAYCAFAIVNAVVPGPNLLVALRTLLGSGVGAAHAAIAGIGTGVTVYGLGSSWGLERIAAASPLVYGAVKLAGAAWVYWLGMKLVREGIRPAPRRAPEGTADAVPGSGRRHFGVGLLTALFNPNIALFFLAVLPQFALEPGSRPASTLPAMIVLYVGVSVGWMMVVVAVVSRFGVREASGPISTVVHVGIGLWLMMFGLLFLQDR